MGPVGLPVGARGVTRGGPWGIPWGPVGLPVGARGVTRGGPWGTRGGPWGYPWAMQTEPNWGRSAVGTKPSKNVPKRYTGHTNCVKPSALAGRESLKGKQTGSYVKPCKLTKVI